MPWVTYEFVAGSVTRNSGRQVHTIVTWPSSQSPGRPSTPSVALYALPRLSVCRSLYSSTPRALFTVSISYMINMHCRNIQHMTNYFVSSVNEGLWKEDFNCKHRFTQVVLTAITNLAFLALIFFSKYHRMERNKMQCGEVYVWEALNMWGWKSSWTSGLPLGNHYRVILTRVNSHKHHYKMTQFHS